MEEELSLDNILDEVQIDNLFNDSEDSREKVEDTNEENTTDKKEKKDNIVEVNPDDLFGEPESVDNNKEDSNKEKEDTESAESVSPPTNNFYSSIANALAEEGIFQNLDEDSLKDVTTPEAFVELVDNEVKNRLDERYKMLDEALSAGLEPSEIQKFSNTIKGLTNVTDEAINDETERGERLRKGLIFQDYINKGFTKERADKEVTRSFKAGTDIEDAKEALEELKNFYTTQYDNAIKEGKRIEAQNIAEQKKFMADLKNSILEEDTAFGDLKIDRATRRKVYENTLIPNQTDPETGERISTMQKYERTNRKDFIKNLGLLFTLTDGFTNINALLQGKVKKEVKKGMRELEKTINHTSRNSNGSLNFMSGISDVNSKVTNWELDI